MFINSKDPTYIISLKLISFSIKQKCCQIVITYQIQTKFMYNNNLSLLRVKYIIRKKHI